MVVGNLSSCNLSCDNWDTRPDPYSILTVVSSTLSIVGCLSIIISYACLPSIRTVTRAILVFLAVADLFTAMGYLYAAVTALSGFQSLVSCKVQSFVTTTFPISSFLWTLHLSVYIYVALKTPHAQWKTTLSGHKHLLMMVAFHLTGWGIPLLICIPVASAGWYGTGSRTSVSWCFVELGTVSANMTAQGVLARYFILELVCGKFWEISVAIITLLLCSVIVYRLKRNQALLATQTSYGSLSITQKVLEARNRFDRRLVWVPILFILLRLWGNLRFFISFDPKCHCEIEYANYTAFGFEPQCCDVLYSKFLLAMQSIGDPGQGWANAILFVLTQRKLCPCLSSSFKEMCCCCCRVLFKRSKVETVQTDSMDGVKWHNGGKKQASEVISSSLNSTDDVIQ